jgi:group I intron endonuclease
MKGVVYEIYNKISSKVYIGSTISFQKRKSDHLYNLRRGIHVNGHLQNSFNKYGEEAFDFVVVYTGEDYLEVEQMLIAKSNFKEIYNINRNVSGGDILSYHPDKEDICQRISLTLRKLRSIEDNAWSHIDFSGDKNPNWRGGIYETKITCGCGNPKAFAAKTCIKCYDKSGENNPFYGKTHSEETLNIISEVRKGITPANAKRVSVEGVEYESCRHAADALGIPYVTVHYRCCKSKNEKFDDWFEVGNPKTDSYKPVNPNATIIICEGVEYPSYSEAAKAYKLSITAIINRVRSDNYPDFYKSK